MEGDPRSFGVAEATLAAVDEEVKRLIDACYQQALTLLRENRHRLENIVTELLERETLDEAEVYAAADIPRGAVPQKAAE
jgi:cell division protease FtsH